MLALVLLLASQAPPANCVAAVALRDYVPWEQRIGTEAFTQPLLASSYAEHTYITATATDDGREELLGTLRGLANRGCTVDLFFLANNGWFSSWVAALDERPKLRLVYDTGGGDAEQGPHWLALGATTFVGHAGDNIAPIFFARFLPAWLRGETVGLAADEANIESHALLEALRFVMDDRTIDTLWAGTDVKIFGSTSLTF